MKRRERAPTSAGLALAGTLVVHGVAGAFLIAAAPEGRAATPLTYKVRLVAAPAPDPNAPRAPEAIERPAEAPAPVAVKKTAPRNTAAQLPPPKTADATQREAAPRTTSPVQLAPGEKPSTGNDVATVSTAGVDFPFPEYTDNITSQVRRRWQRPEQSVPLEAELSFIVHRDGSVSGLQFVKRSGNFAFDLEAQGAVEEAARFKAFGALPSGWVADVLFVRFFFSGRQ
jgi:outer membrane biosynthesis protein TonB